VNVSRTHRESAPKSKHREQAKACSLPHRLIRERALACSLDEEAADLLAEAFADADNRLPEFRQPKGRN